ncbi:hypothetical protein WG66_006643 [Moniliophthora roreri]|nr:hypothetical protein WG66_006643 [Moniliophthora roreri]
MSDVNQPALPHVRVLFQGPPSLHLMTSWDPTRLSISVPMRESGKNWKTRRTLFCGAQVSGLNRVKEWGTAEFSHRASNGPIRRWLLERFISNIFEPSASIYYPPVTT